MNEIDNGIVKIGVFYDGNYFLNVSNYYYYSHQRRQRISIWGLHEFIKNRVAMEEGVRSRYCQIIDAHYFKGRLRAKDLSQKENRLYFERVFDDILMYEGVTTHYLPIKYVADKKFEKGIDVWLALEAYELSIYRKFDVVALVACDGDYVPLIRKLNSLGVKVVLISWEYEFITEMGDTIKQKTSNDLLNLATYPFLMNEVIEKEKNEMVDNLFVESFAFNPEEESINEEEYITADGTTRLSNIFSLKAGYGFIKYPNNNLFFHFSSITNGDFNDIQVGDEVEFELGKNDKGDDVATNVKLTGN